MKGNTVQVPLTTVDALVRDLKLSKVPDAERSHVSKRPRGIGFIFLLIPDQFSQFVIDESTRLW